MMPAADFFTKHGLFAVKGFFDRDFCVDVIDEIRDLIARGYFKQGNVLGDPNQDLYVNEEVKRRSESISLSPETISKVREKLIGVKPQVAEHLGVGLTDCQNIKFAVYTEGDYFRQHVDRVSDERAPHEIRDRKVSVVVFLNAGSEQPAEGAFGGGKLTFYGLLDNSPFATFGFPLEPETGLFIAFPPTLPHEVTPVTHGVRYVLVTWYV